MRENKIRKTEVKRQTEIIKIYLHIFPDCAIIIYNCEY